MNKLKNKLNNIFQVILEGYKLSKIGFRISRSATSKYLHLSFLSEIVSRTSNFGRTIILGLFINEVISLDKNYETLYLYLTIIVLIELIDGLAVSYLDAKIGLYVRFVEQNIFEMVLEKYTQIPVKYRNEEKFLEIERNLKPDSIITLIDNYIYLFGSFYSVFLAFIAITFIDYRILLLAVIAALLNLYLKFKNKMLEFSLREERGFNRLMLSTSQNNFKKNGISFLDDNVKTNQNYKFLYDKYHKSKEKYQSYYYGYFERVEKLDLYSQYIITIATSIILGYLYYLGILGVMEIGTLSIIVTSYTRFLNNMGSISTYLSRLLNQYLEIKSFVSFIDYADFQVSDENLKRKKEFEIEFKNVWFKYPAATEYVLEDVSFKVSKGDKLAVIGINGAGKSTLTKLLFKAFVPERGEILINGQNILNVKDEDIFDVMTTLSQNKSMEENLTPEELIYLGNTQKKMNIKKIIEASKKTLAFDFIEKLPKKFKQKLSVMGPSGLTLLNKFGEENYKSVSPGQRRRLLISRIIYSEKPIIVLDEPTSDVDQLATNEIFNAISKITNNEILILISHDILRVNKIVNKVLVIENGKVVEFGNKIDLIKKKDSRFKFLLENYKEEVKL